MNESITISLRLTTDEDSSALARVAEHYAGLKWLTSQIIGCAPTLRDHPVLSMLDLDPRDRVHYKSMPIAAWPLRVEVYRLRSETSGKRDERVIQFGLSSIRCPWLEHPVEILVPLKEPAPGAKRAHRGAEKDTARVVDELRALCCDVGARWAILSNGGRGPSQPELSQDARPSSVDVSTLFLSDDTFDHAAVNRLTRLAHAERWPLGWFFTVNPFFGGPVVNCDHFEREAWILLRGWQRRMSAATR